VLYLAIKKEAYGSPASFAVRSLLNSVKCSAVVFSVSIGHYMTAVMRLPTIWTRGNHPTLVLLLSVPVRSRNPWLWKHQG